MAMRDNGQATRDGIESVRIIPTKSQKRFVISGTTIGLLLTLIGTVAAILSIPILQPYLTREPAASTNNRAQEAKIAKDGAIGGLSQNDSQAKNPQQAPTQPLLPPTLQTTPPDAGKSVFTPAPGAPSDVVEKNVGEAGGSGVAPANAGLVAAATGQHTLGKAAPSRAVMMVGANPLGLSATVSRPIIHANKWTIMTVTVTLHAGSDGLIALPADVYYNMPGWSAEVGDTAAQCTSNNDRVRWPGGRGKAVMMSAGDEIALPIEFTCGRGGEFQPGGALTIHMQLLADAGSGMQPVRMSAKDIAYNQK